MAVARPDDLHRAIREGGAELGLSLDEAASERLAALIRLLDKWNRVYNLTAVRRPEEMVTRHILDSLSVLPYLSGRRLLDVGTGAGLPGLPLAVACPHIAFTLLDANTKKLRFVRQAVAELALDNVEVVHARMQEYQPAQAFDMVISRAVASLDELYRQSVHLLADGGHMLFMKGTLPGPEMADFAPGREALHTESLRIPGLDAQRHLLWFEKRAQ